MGQGRRRGADRLTVAAAFKLLLSGRVGRLLSIGLPYAWLLLFFLLPFLIVLKISFAEPVLGQPPYTPLAQLTDARTLELHLNLGNYLLVGQD